ncbi:MAG: hypothetical protein KDB01_14950 [Planctomycetaceae bacterium]|nr:hypothetical protein [Planctomycetaceae bacterium]
MLRFFYPAASYADVVRQLSGSMSFVWMGSCRTVYEVVPVASDIYLSRSVP